MVNGFDDPMVRAVVSGLLVMVLIFLAEAAMGWTLQPVQILFLFAFALFIAVRNYRVAKRKQSD